MSQRILEKIDSPKDLQQLDAEDLAVLAQEIREEIIDVVSKNPGHLSSNLGVVELTIALHCTFDFLNDKLVWDVGHQTYVHKLLTGRRKVFPTLRQYKGLSGFPDIKESEYDPFTCGHSGHAISAALGIACADKINNIDRTIIAVVGDAAMGAGMSLEALNHAGHLKKNLIVILNDNKMAISNTVGAIAKHINKIRTTPLYADFKKEVHHVLQSLPIVGKRMEHTLEHITEALKREITPGQIFVDLGFDYFGPIDGHNIQTLTETLQNIKNVEGPVLLHVITEKGKGFEPASTNPERYHSAGNFKMHNGKVKETPKDPKQVSYTKVFGKTIVELAEANKDIVAITAAMPDGTGLDAFSREFPDRYFDVGICEQHAIGLANGMAAAGLKPVAAIYSTFLQRAYDQVFHDVCLQKNGILLALDRAGIVGNDGPTHNGVFDIAYLRHLPGITLMAPKDGAELKAMLHKAVQLNIPAAIRYPRANIPEGSLDNDCNPVEIGKGEILREGRDGVIIAYGAMVYPSMECADMLDEKGIDVTVVNARFAKPLDEDLIMKVIGKHQRVLTVEDHTEVGGFGSAILELLVEKGINTQNVHKMGIPDRFTVQGSRDIILKTLDLDAEGIYKNFISTWNLTEPVSIKKKDVQKQTSNLI
ncbi:MAG: 1-deoxy-D-xylulose-5-phosphate synthase [Candidatus Scalindua arabica]|uniref:1-deoxy-D-xylulose-5-phosphate synthase n=1 Tax=Candidatus Scalindua arabica TaxID=1127984 RepID=A0A941W3K0_9BACT|nr:1-deoxy-D-xylulose-5-phosphate synthase [Candidatus Scalindua arabica]